MSQEARFTAYAKRINKCLVANCDADAGHGMFCRKCRDEMYSKPVDVNKQTLLFMGIVGVSMICIAALVKWASGL